MPSDPPPRHPLLPDPPADEARPWLDELEPPDQRHPLDGRRREWTLVARHADTDAGT
jgi:hypothetical protein